MADEPQNPEAAAEHSVTEDLAADASATITEAPPVGAIGGTAERILNQDEIDSLLGFPGLPGPTNAPKQPCRA